MASRTLDEIRTLLQRLAQEDLEDAPVDELVEVGTVLNGAASSVKKALDEIKKALRLRAAEELNHKPGSVTLEGTDIGRTTVTVPSPQLTLAKGTDPAVLQRILGADFDIFFETRTTYLPRSNAAELVTS